MSNWLEVTTISRDSSKEKSRVVCSPVTRVRGYFDFPAISIDRIPWAGSSFIVAEINFEFLRNFSLLNWTKPANPPFCLCISYQLADTRYRYKLWNDVGEYLWSCSNYNGERILKDFKLELWSIYGGDTINYDGLSRLVSSLLINPNPMWSGDDVDLGDGTITTGRWIPSKGIITLPQTFRTGTIQEHFGDGIGYWIIEDTFVVS